MTLYELTGQYRELLDMAECGDVDPDVLRDTLEAVGGEIEDKAEGYACIIKQLEADAVALKTEEDRLAARRKSIENNIKSMKAALQNAMYATGKTKFKTNLFSFGIQRNAPSLYIADMDMIPGRFMVPQPDLPDKAAIKEYLKENGDQSWAQLQQGESLRIR
jgi:hypothetical protein